MAVFFVARLEVKVYCDLFCFMFRFRVSHKRKEAPSMQLLLYWLRQMLSAPPYVRRKRGKL